MGRSQNGKARNTAYLLTFDVDIEAQSRAWAVMQKLAEKRRSKKTLIGFLLALDEIQRQTRNEYSVEEMMALFIKSVVTGSNAPPLSPGLSLGDFAEEPALIFGTAEHDDPDLIRDQLALSMGNLFDD